MNQQNLIIYKTADAKTSVALYAENGDVWLNQNQLAELFDTSKSTISEHLSNILKEKELLENTVIRKLRTTATDGKKYDVDRIQAV